MPITKTDGVITETPIADHDQFQRTGVIRDSSFALADEKDVTKQIKFNATPLDADATVTVTAGASSGDVVITLPATTSTIPTLAFLETENIAGMIETPAVKTYTLDLKASYAYQIQTLSTILTSGTATAKVQIDDEDVTGLTAISVSSTITNSTATAARDVAADSKVTLVVSAVADPVDLAFSMKVKRV